MEPISTKMATEAPLAAGDGIAGTTEPIESAWTAEPISIADQSRFEGAMTAAGPGRTSTPTFDGHPFAHPSQEGGIATLGDAILNGLRTLEQNGSAVRTEIAATLSKPELTSGDMLKMQFDVMSLNIELQTTTNMAHHGVEDIKTIMRGQ